MGTDRDVLDGVHKIDDHAHTRLGTGCSDAAGGDRRVTSVGSRVSRFGT